MRALFDPDQAFRCHNQFFYGLCEPSAFAKLDVWRDGDGSVTQARNGCPNIDRLVLS